MKVFVAAVPLGFMAACSPPQTPPEPAPKPTPQATVFDPLVQQVDRAKQVQGTVDSQSAEVRKQVAEAEGSGEH